MGVLSAYLASLNVLPSTKARYLSHVEMAYARIRGPRSPRGQLAVQDLRDALRRQQQAHPARQARPATREEVEKLFRLDPTGMGLLVATQWATASRYGDLQAVEARDVEVTDAGALITLRQTKTTNAVGIRTVACVLPSVVRQALVQAMAERNRPFEVPYYRYLNFLKREETDLSAHSIRRGAVQAAMRRGSDKQVMRLTGHMDVKSLAIHAGRIPTKWRLDMEKASRDIWRC